MSNTIFPQKLKLFQKSINTVPGEMLQDAGVSLIIRTVIDLIAENCQLFCHLGTSHEQKIINN